MRWVVVAIFALCLGQPASAADMGILRGSTGYEPAPRLQNWEGFYIGGQVGTGGGGANFGNTGQSLLSGALVNTWLAQQGVGSWLTATKGDTGQALQYGAFVGYNGQWGNVVLGLETSYNHTNLNATATGRAPVSGGLMLTDPSNYVHSVRALSTSTITLTDVATVRGRAGWAVDRFLPYLMAGVAIGRASWLTSAWAGYPDSQPGPGFTPPDPGPWNTGWVSEGKSASLIYGWSTGLGMDVALMPNVFLRAEYEFIQFSQMHLNLNNARVGLGVRF